MVQWQAKGSSRCDCSTDRFGPACQCQRPWSNVLSKTSDLEQPTLLCYVEGDWSLRSFSPEAVGVRLHDEKMLKAERSCRHGSAEEDALCSSVQIFLTCEFGE